MHTFSMLCMKYLIKPLSAWHAWHCDVSSAAPVSHTQFHSNSLTKLAQKLSCLYALCRRNVKYNWYWTWDVTPLYNNCEVMKANDVIPMSQTPPSLKWNHLHKMLWTTKAWEFSLEFTAETCHFGLFYKYCAQIEFMSKTRSWSLLPERHTYKLLRFCNDLMILDALPFIILLCIF